MFEEVSGVKIFVCKDLGGSCSWKGRAKTVEELINKVAKHGVIKHNMTAMSDTMEKRIVSVIREK